MASRCENHISEAAAPPMASNGAVSAVFSTIELLEMILLEVAIASTRTVLLSQWVSMVFRDTVQDSTKLQDWIFSSRAAKVELIRGRWIHLRKIGTRGAAVRVDGWVSGTWRTGSQNESFESSKARADILDGSWQHMRLTRGGGRVKIRVFGEGAMFLQYAGEIFVSTNATLGTLVRKIASWHAAESKTKKAKLLGADFGVDGVRVEAENCDWRSCGLPAVPGKPHAARLF